jgi:hypothetical protein
MGTVAMLKVAVTVQSGKLYVSVYVQHIVQQLGVPDDINWLPSFMHMPGLVAGSLLTFSCHDFGECSGASLSADLLFCDYSKNWFINYCVFVV